MKTNMNPGMDETQAQKDRGGFKTELGYVTGGMSYDYDDHGGPEVGNPYDGDPMGEEYQKVTHVEYPKGMGKKYPMGK